MAKRRGVIPTWVADFEQLEREDLLALWTKAHGRKPFRGARRGTILRGVSYAEQIRREGDLSKRTKRKLMKLAAGDADTSKKSSTSAAVHFPKIQLGTQLVREWNGKTYTVHVTDKGCVLNGVTYG